MKQLSGLPPQSGGGSAACPVSDKGSPTEAGEESGVVQAERRATSPQTLRFAQGDSFKSTSCARAEGVKGTVGIVVPTCSYPGPR